MTDIPVLLAGFRGCDDHFPIYSEDRFEFIICQMSVLHISNVIATSYLSCCSSPESCPLFQVSYKQVRIQLLWLKIFPVSPFILWAWPWFVVETELLFAGARTSVFFLFWAFGHLPRSSRFPVLSRRAVDSLPRSFLDRIIWFFVDAFFLIHRPHCRVFEERQDTMWEMWGTM